MRRTVSTLLLALAVIVAGCTFEAGAGGYVFKPPPKEDVPVPEDTPPDPGPDLGQACFDFFACILSISTQGGDLDSCTKEAPPELVPYIEAIRSCQMEFCNDLKFDPESDSFVPVAFRNCLKYSCPEALIGCFAHEENEEGCKRYVVCEQNCADTGVACDLDCMSKLSPDDVLATVDYLNCMEEFAEVPDTGITAKLCECLGICEVPYSICDDRDR
ncbi:MAG: hypothetical protein ABIK09_07235 [Pseudomonadota bacterium]